ncbi:hypothetical protein PHYSODRAFT_421666, partial [Phytophthora sojae]
RYLDTQWWPHKKKFVRCWTDKFSHFGCRHTSTVEGTHATMKGWLENSRGDLLKVFQDLIPWWLTAASRNSLQAANDAGRIPIVLRGVERYSTIVKIISVWAITETNALWAKVHKIVVHGLERSTCAG